jgi:myosin heavy subunit
VNDKEIYAEPIMHAFKSMGVTDEQRSNCFDVVAAVLALGNLSFELIAGAKDDEAQAHITAATAPYLATAAALLGCEPAHIISYEESLTSWQATKA